MEKRFDNVTLFVTHYNRSQSLDRLLTSMQNAGLRFKEIVVSDDCSSEMHQERLGLLKERFHFILLTSAKNKGLANNINKALSKIITPYTLYVQEDFVPTPLFLPDFETALSLMDEMPETDIVRFYANYKYKYLSPVSDDFSRMDFHFWRPGFKQFYCYSDPPHLRRSNFTEKFGTYVEGIHSDKSEYRMVLSFLKNKGVALIHDNYQGLFTHENNAQEQSKVHRTELKKFLQRTDFLLIKMLRVLYRNIKFRADYVLFKTGR